jgi:hypothetical protein
MAEEHQKPQQQQQQGEVNNPENKVPHLFFNPTALMHLSRIDRWRRGVCVASRTLACELNFFFPPDYMYR